ncbi:MAG: hypothetical protein EXR07_21550 [Acetobacteraceae bacterium]|nr:hypothetical protein [Acetobacteraceae bacterium]
MTTPLLLYTAELDLADADVESFLQWYAWRHAPDVYRVGFHTCACYRVPDGDMNLFDLYELPSWNLFETQRYQAMRGRDPYMDALMERRLNKAHTVYDQILIAPNASGPCLDADWISVFRFAVPEEADDAIVGALSRHQPLMEAAGLTRLRYAVRGQDHPRNPTFRPRCMVVAEWAEQPPRDLGIPDILHSVAGEAISDDTAFTGHRVYPWPDRPL